MPRLEPEARLAAMAPLLHPGLTGEDAAAAVRALAPLQGLLAAAAPDWGTEPATLFDPLVAFTGQPAAAWPTDVPPAGPTAVPGAADQSPWPAATPPSGSLRGDIASVATGRVDPDAIASGYRARIAALQPHLNAFILVCASDDPQARGAVAAEGTGAPQPLRGAALALKDMIETAGVATSGGSQLRANHVPTADATCWARLRAGGATLLGKTNTHEFAAGTTNENAAFGVTRNPYDRERVAGGSSGGSAVAVATGMAGGALGTDTGGSIRIPAACCGVVGFKPTYGRVSRRGVFALSWSLDHVGPIARTVADAALLFGWMAGADPGDPTTLHQMALPTPEALGLPRAGLWHGLRIGIPEGWLACAGTSAVASGGLPTASAVRQAFERALQHMVTLGATPVPCDLGSPDEATAINRIIALSESAAYHAADLDARLEQYGANVRGRMLAGRFLLAEEYMQAQRWRAHYGRRCAAALAGPRGVHLVATPTLPTVAPPIGAPASSGLALLRFCAPFNVTGWPALTLPCDRSPEGLPIGLQLAAAPFHEPELLSAAAALERALGAEAHAVANR